MGSTKYMLRALVGAEQRTVGETNRAGEALQDVGGRKSEIRWSGEQKDGGKRGAKNTSKRE
jgi:hypothetical protein